MGVLLEDLWEGNKEARFEILSGREEWGSEVTWNLQSCVIVQVSHLCELRFSAFLVQNFELLKLKRKLADN